MLYAINQTMLTPSPSAAELAAITSRLQDWVSIHSKDAQAWSWLSRVQLAQNKQVRSAIASAEAMRAQLDDSAALAQYQAAQNLIRRGVQADSIDAAIVDSKVRELQVLTRESQKNKR
jgi:predicted Zn-dependent protease